MQPDQRLGQAFIVAHQAARQQYKATLDRGQFDNFQADAMRLSRSSSLVTGVALVHDRACDLEHALGRAHARALAFDREIDRARTLAGDLGRTSAHGGQGEGEALREQVRRNALLLVADLLGHLAGQGKPRMARLRPGVAAREHEAEIQRIADGYLDLYLDYCVLEARIADELPAFEDIRLARERQPT